METFRESFQRRKTGKAKVFIDGSAGTTGLRIRERLLERDDIELILLDEASRKDTEARRDALNRADIAFLCLPDAASAEAVSLVSDPDTVLIDTSSAHRVAKGWVYGFPELNGQRMKIACAKRIANPGCHASGFIALIAPLADRGAIRKDEMLSCFSLTGYSGGGKRMIGEYENPELQDVLRAPRLYALAQNHKHLPEMRSVCVLKYQPIFTPIVAPYYAGMTVVVPVFAEQLFCGPEELKRIYREYYAGSLVKYVDRPDTDGVLTADGLAGRDDMEITLLGDGERILLVARFDNLGKGASGAAVQNLNILLGTDEAKGLVTGANREYIGR